MRCPRCQHENGPQAKFCQECAAPLARTCAKCGNKLPSTAKFCPECAHPAGDAVATDPGRFSSPETYTPKHLAEKILISKAALEGERKQVTVLFADLKGSMELLADRDPEEARKLLDPILEHMMEAVHRYEGTVNQVMGDGIMALFGAPLAHEDHAVRACYAALRMQESVKRYAEGVRREQGITIRIRVGLNSGEVVVRAIGSDLHMDYTAVGQTTHLAARMEQLADPGSILLTPDTLTLAEGFVRVTQLGPMAVRGLPLPVEVYELAGVSAVRSRLQAAAARGLSRFVGRDAEIEHLRRALEQAGQGRGQIAAVVGEPGVGKSRLVFELTHSHRVEGWLVLESGSVSYGKATSYLPVIDLLKGYFGIGDRDTYRDIREKVTGKILTLDRVLESAIPALFALLDVPIEDPQWSALDPPQRRRQTLDAVKRLLLREAQVQPLLVVFEDLHWIDSETQAMLDSLVESLPTARVFLLVNYRPEYSHGWGRKTYYTQLRLDTLPPESTEELLDALLGHDASLLPLKTLLASRTGGNPLFLEESVRALVETKALAGERAEYRLAQPVDTVQVPVTVQAILTSRIDRLPPEEKRLLETAAVIGKDFAFPLLQAIAGETDETLRRGLEHLQAAEFLYETSLFPDLEYTFKHALTHEVAYGSLLHERRRALHVQIVGAIEALYPDRLTEQIERLGQHAFRGEQWGKAASYLRQAGWKAAERTAHREAVSFLEQALKAAEQLADGADKLQQAVDLRIDLRNSLFGLGDLQRVFHYLREAGTLAGALEDQERSCRVASLLTHYFWVTGDHDRAVETGEKAVVIARDLKNANLEFMSRYYLGLAYHGRGHYNRAVDHQRAVIASVETGRLHRAPGIVQLPSVISGMFLVWSLAEQGKFVEGMERGKETVQIAEENGRPANLIHGYMGSGFIQLRRGDVQLARRWLERALQVSQTANLPFYLPWITCSLGYAHALSHQAAEAFTHLNSGVQHASSMKVMAYHALWLAYLSEAHMLVGQIDDAQRVAERALELSLNQREYGSKAWALRMMGEVASHREPPDAEKAGKQYEQAITLATELGMRPLVAHCHFGLGKLCRRTGKREQAQEHLTTATTMYREMDMRFWLEQAEAESMGLGA
jgi:class 3 adenylate cyclase/tetratricopeptide (TPR) repeat protein